MNPPGDPTRHFWLTQGVARALGISFTEALLARRLEKNDFARLVERCQACTQSGACIDWLARHGSAASAAPDFCRNRARLAALRRAP